MQAVREVDATNITTTKLPDLNQLAESTNEEVDYEVQEDSEYAMEPAHLEKQEFYFASTNATGNTSDVIREMIESNTRNGITTENIMDVVFRSNNFTSRNVPAFSELSSTNATLPQLPNESGIAGTTVAGLSTLSAYIIAPVLLVAAATVGGCRFLRKQKREDSYDVEKAGVENKVEAPFSEEQNSLLDEVNIESGMYQSFRRNVD